MAFCIGPLTYSSAFGVDTLFLLRSDKESVGAKMTDALPSNSVSADWLIESSATCFIARLKAMAHAFGTILHGKIPDECARDSYYNHLANDRLQRGLKQLSSYGYIVSDRLHVHILCTLLGIPHTILDNNYGKVRSFSQTWSTNIDKAYFAGDIEQAITHLRRL
jgi:pyruvyl transferase EpsO